MDYEKVAIKCETLEEKIYSAKILGDILSIPQSIRRDMYNVFVSKSDKHVTAWGHKPPNTTVLSFKEFIDTISQEVE